MMKTKIRIFSLLVTVCLVCCVSAGCMPKKPSFRLKGYLGYGKDYVYASIAVGREIFSVGKDDEYSAEYYGDRLYDIVLYCDDEVVYTEQRIGDEYNLIFLGGPIWSDKAEYEFKFHTNKSGLYRLEASAEFNYVYTNDKIIVAASWEEQINFAENNN